MNYLMIIITFIAFSYVSNQDYEDKYENAQYGSKVRQQIQPGENLPR